jgi:hypothetical protein
MKSMLITAGVFPKISEGYEEQLNFIDQGLNGLKFSSIIAI